MATDDVYAVNLFSESQGVAMANTMKFREVAPATPGTELTNVLNMVQIEIVPNVAVFTSVDWTFTCISARKETPPSTSTKTQFISVPGDVAGDSLPTTCYASLRYYGEPYKNGSVFHFKFSGIPEPNTGDGQLKAEQLLLYDPLIAKITDLITFAGASYVLCTPSAQIPFIPPNPAIVKAFPNPCILNQRSRQTRLCSI